MTQRTAPQRRPKDSQGSRSSAIACHGAIRFLPRVNRFTTGGDEVYTCDSGCRERSNNMYRMASGFIQILDHDPIPLCAQCLKEARKALAEINEKIIAPGG